MTGDGEGGPDMPFTSALDVNGFAGLRTLGFEPVGQVTGTAVFQQARAYATCGAGPRRVPVADEPWQQFERQARRLALDRMRQECTAVGGHGVVGVGLAVRPFVGDTVEFVASGTAVRAGPSRPVRRARPFTAGVDATGVVKLLRAGWMPVSVVFGVAVRAVHDMSSELEQMSLDNVELTTATHLVRTARAAARSALAADAAQIGAHSVILNDMGLTVAEQPCRATRAGPDVEPEDRIAQADMTGTAIVRLHRPIATTAGRPLSIMRLDRDRRTAATWRTKP